jgi:hypothetical protein
MRPLPVTECFQPVGGVEAAIVKSIADGRWQLHRATAIEDAIFALDIGHLDPSAKAAHWRVPDPAQWFQTAA